MNIHEQTPSLLSLMMLLEARDDFLIQTFGQKLVDKVTDENDRGMPLPADLTATLKVADETPPANKIVAWFVSNDPIQGKGSQWMIVQYIRGNFQLEDIDQVKHSLTEFVRIRSQLEVKDLGQYKTLQALNIAMEPFQDKKVVSKREARKNMEIDPAIKPQVNILLDTGETLVAIPTTHAASKYLASTDFMGYLTEYRAANWCTARNEPNYFNSHTRQGPLYFIFIKSGPDAGKYQFHFETTQFHNSANSRIPNLRGWLLRNEEVRQVLESKAAEHGVMEFLSPEAAKAYLQQYLDNGAVTQLLDQDGVTVFYLPSSQSRLHTYLMGGSGTGGRSFSRWHNKAQKVQGSRYGDGVLYIELANNTVFTYMLGYASTLYGDATPYPIKNLTSKAPAVKELLSTMMRDAGVDQDDQTDPAVQELISSGAAKQVFSSDAVTAWWVDSVATFRKYFNVKGAALQRMYTDTPTVEGAGVMILDVGSQLVSFRLGDGGVIVLDADELSDASTGYINITNVPINKFMLEYPATVPIIKKYADHYGYYPLMTDKAKAKRMVELEEQGVITVIKKDSPSVVQLMTAGSVNLVRPLIQMDWYSRSEDNSIVKAITAEIARGPVFLIQGTIILSSSLGGTFQINSNNGTAAMSTKMVFERFPALATILKDQLTAAGITAGGDVPLGEIVTGLATSGAIVPIQPNPLVLQLNNVTAARWFVEHHAGAKITPQNNVEWGIGGIITGYDKVFTDAGSRTGAAVTPGTKAFGFLGKGNVPLILSVKPGVRNDTPSMVIYATFNPPNVHARSKDITTTQGVVAFMQKYPDVLRAIIPQLGNSGSSTMQDLVAVAGGAGADPYSQTTSAITGIMKSLKTSYTSTNNDAQAVSELNAEKFNKGCYGAAAYLKEYAGQFTVEQVNATADRIINVMKYTSKESLRTMPRELAEWLKYATQLSDEEVQAVVIKYPVFIAGMRQVPIHVMRRIYAAGISNDIEVARLFGRMDPGEEATMDREIFGNRLFHPIGVDYNNVVQEVEAYERRAGNTNLFTEKLYYMRNVPAHMVIDYLNRADSVKKIRLFLYPPEDAVIAAYRANSGVATAKNIRNGVPFYRKSPKIRAATRYVRQHGSMTGFTYTPPGPVVLPRVGTARPAQPAGTPTNRPNRAARVATPTPPPNGAPQGARAGFATKAAHARHIIDNRTPEDTRPTLIRRLIDDVGLTPAGAATYYYNLTRGVVREGEEDTLSILKTTLRSLFD